MADAQHIIPGEHGHTRMSLPFNGLEKKLADAAGDSFLFGQKVTDVHHVSVGIVVFFILVGSQRCASVEHSRKIRAGGDSRIEI